jgi:hypothetical protein
MTAPSVVAIPVSTPAPGMQVTVTANDVAASTYTLWRQDGLGRRTVIRGALGAVILSAAFVVDLEHPFGEPLQYVAATYDSVGTLIAESSLTSPYTAASTGTWISNPLAPTSAVNVEVTEWPDWTKPVDGAFIPIIGSSDQVVVYGTRSSGSGSLQIHTRTSNERDDLRAVLGSTAIVLVRASSSWDVGVLNLGVPTYRERRLGLADNPARLFTLDVVRAAPLDISIAPVLHTYEELSSYGYLYSTLSAHVGLTYLQLAQQPAGL